MNEQDKIALMNHIITLARPVSSEELKINSLDTVIIDTGLDSLDYLMVTIYLSDVYGITEEDIKLAPQPVLIRDLFNFMEEKATKHPATLQEAIANIV
jgi:acyl carrier protein